MIGSISFAEIMGLVEYLRKFEGGFVEKNYRGEKGFSFKLRKSGLDSTYLHFVDNKYLFVSQENMIDGKKNTLPIENSLISSVRQLGTDRVLLIEGSKSLIIELMAGGNIFVLQEGMVVYSRKPGKRGGKVLSVGDRYEYPRYIDLRSPQFNFETTIRESSSDPIRTLAVRLGLSKYAEELDCAMSHQFKSNSDVLKNIGELQEKISVLYNSARELKLFVYKDEFYVWKSYCRTEDPEVLDIEHGLRNVYERGETEGSRKIAGVKRSVERMTAEMQRFRATGEFIMSHLDEMEHLLKKGKDASTEKYHVDYDKETISFVEGEMNVELKMNETAGENADDYFGMSKRIKDRLSRVSLEPEKEEKRVELKRVTRVFTNYRWFITSDGNLVIAGKDAESNDSVVKKYLGEKDIYLHADIHGAPSVVMRLANKQTEIGIQEGALFAWCMSKAWSSRFGNGSVFYVTKSQVSKTPESGEYLARGAWIIRGKKNYITHLELELAVGFQKYENRDYVVAAPASSVQGKRVIIVPGEGKEEVVREISEFLEVEKESVYPALPPGGWSIKDKITL